jgi:hypothetical protein
MASEKPIKRHRALDRPAAKRIVQAAGARTLLYAVVAAFAATMRPDDKAGF